MAFWQFHPIRKWLTIQMYARIVHIRFAATQQPCWIGVVWTEADKGGGIVVTDSEYYLRKSLDTLVDRSYYETIIPNTTSKHLKKISDLTKNIDLTEKERTYLTQLECKESNFDAFPEIHNSKTLYSMQNSTNSTRIEVLRLEDLSFRPDVRLRLSNLIDILVKTFTNYVKSLIRD